MQQAPRDSGADRLQLNPAGSALVYSTYLGGSRTDIADAVAIDSSGDAYVTGSVQSLDFPVTAGVFQPTLHYTDGIGGQNAFVTKFNPTGTGLIYSTYLGGSKDSFGGSSFDNGAAIAVDPAGNAYVTGLTSDIDFPVTSGALSTQNLSQLDSVNFSSFVTKINPTASQSLYSTYLGGTGGSERRRL